MSVTNKEVSNTYQTKSTDKGRAYSCVGFSCEGLMVPDCLNTKLEEKQNAIVRAVFISVSRKTEPKYSQPLIGAKVAFIINQIELQITSGILRTIKPFLRGSNYVKNIPAVVLQTIVLLRGSTHVSQSSTHLFRPMIAPVYLNDFCLRA